MTTQEEAQKCEWLVELLVREEPRTVFDIARTTGLSRRVVDDAVWAAVQRGAIRVRPDSKLESV